MTDQIKAKQLLAASFWLLALLKKLLTCFRWKAVSKKVWQPTLLEAPSVYQAGFG
ncbi:MAG TPA: hypothetical protein VHA33_22325 [Candidatus Angelobacter sp.]|jgi:hypothetical protein|nr:hypothetical protein [Candidatus Angelobacter sp.]